MPHFDPLASNPAYLALTGDYRLLPVPYRNTMVLYFCETGWRRVMGDWASNAPRLVAVLLISLSSGPNILSPPRQLGRVHLATRGR